MEKIPRWNILKTFAITILSSTGACFAQATATFQEGVNGYTGCKTVNISDSQIGEGSNRNGITYADGKNDWCIGLLHVRSGFGYDISPLIRFDNLSLPPGAVVQSAVLSIHFTNWEQPARIIGRYLKPEWDGNVIDPEGGLSNASIGWATRQAGIAWAQPGALGEGTDLIAGKEFAFPTEGTIPANGKALYSTPLDPDVVQGWLLNPSTNPGIKLQVDREDVHISFSQAQRPMAAERPLLTITYVISNAIIPLSRPSVGMDKDSRFEIYSANGARIFRTVDGTRPSVWGHPRGKYFLLMR